MQHITEALKEMIKCKHLLGPVSQRVHVGNVRDEPQKLPLQMTVAVTTRKEQVPAINFVMSMNYKFK